MPKTLHLHLHLTITFTTCNYSYQAKVHHLFLFSPNRLFDPEVQDRPLSILYNYFLLCWHLFLFLKLMCSFCLCQIHESDNETPFIDFCCRSIHLVKFVDHVLYFFRPFSICFALSLVLTMTNTHLQRNDHDFLD